MGARCLISDTGSKRLGTDCLLRPMGGRWFWRGVTILKQAPFGGVNFSLVKNMRGVKFYDSNSSLGNLTSVIYPRSQKKRI